jgi:hypothetical protein
LVVALEMVVFRPTPRSRRGGGAHRAERACRGTQT